MIVGTEATCARVSPTPSGWGMNEKKEEIEEKEKEMKKRK